MWRFVIVPTYARPRSSANKEKWNFYGSEFRHGIFWGLNFGPGILLGFVWSPRDVFGFWFLPPFDHPCHLKSGPTSPSPTPLPWYHKNFKRKLRSFSLFFFVIYFYIYLMMKYSFVLYHWKAPQERTGLLLWHVRTQAYKLLTSHCGLIVFITQEHGH